MNSKILQLHEEIISNKTTVEDLVEKAITASNACPSASLAFNTNTLRDIEHAKKDSKKTNLLFGIPYSLKDLYSTKHIVTTAGSLILKDYVPSYNATVFDRLISSGAILISKTNLDEFGMGGTGLSSAYKPIINPFNEEKIVGGSSSGAAVQIALGAVPFALGTDTGDSVRTPASYMGIVGFKPTYGAISKYGVIPFAPSLDTVGINAKHVVDVAIVAHAISGVDEKDCNTIDIEFSSEVAKVDKINITIIDGIEAYLPAHEKEIYLNNVAILSKKFNVVKKQFDLKYIEAISAVYMVIAYSEASSTFSNFNGVSFGNVNENSEYEKRVSNFRSKGFADKVKRLLIIGASCLDEENYENVFIKAKKVRAVLRNEFNKLLEGSDCLITPSHSMFASTKETLMNGSFNGPENWYAADLLNLANFAGAPSITIPTYCHKDENFGININGKSGTDKAILDIAYTLEDLFI
ncbi:MAG: Asp-tRNA(Asn)/Glu-tRNA(Gln) amidotransferase subunit GatA [Mycoplasmataceae bacterium]|nr:Asp-tRNA(Asn)/Glu-tRNA(Gln) amidotransferase subunit GatA [Mycoplasmataceae bacterium]